MILEHFRGTGVYEARWDQAVSSASEIHTEMFLEGFTSQNYRILFSVRLYWPCKHKRMFENYEPPNNSRLVTTVRRHIDQTMRPRNFRAWKEMVERGTVTKSHKGEKASVDRKVGECYQWKTIGQCSKGDSCSFSHDPATGNRRDEKDNRPLLHQERRHRLTEKCPHRIQAAEAKVLLEQEVGFRVDISFGRQCTSPSCNFLHPPRVSQLQV